MMNRCAVVHNQHAARVIVIVMVIENEVIQILFLPEREKASFINKARSKLGLWYIVVVCRFLRCHDQICQSLIVLHILLNLKLILNLKIYTLYKMNATTKYDNIICKENS